MVSGWRDLIADKTDRVLPWFGGPGLSYRGRTWWIAGPRPPEHGWWTFSITGTRETKFVGPGEPDPDLDVGHEILRGYLIGDRFVPDSVRVDPDPDKFVEQTVPVFMVEPGLARFDRVTVAVLEFTHVFIRREFPLGPESDVDMAYLDRKPDLNGIPGVTPALDLAFRFVSRQRVLAEAREQARLARRAEEERRQVLEGHRQEALRRIGTGAGRRAVAVRDFDAAARAALAVSGAEFLEARPSYHSGEMVVRYRFLNRRFECTAESDTLRIIDSGICLRDSGTGETGDTRFTLESLPGVIAEAVRDHKLVVYRHVEDERHDGRDPWDDDD